MSNTKTKKKKSTSKKKTAKKDEPKIENPDAKDKKPKSTVIHNPKGKVISGWYNDELPIPNRITRSELNEILDEMVSVGFEKRNLTMLPLQGIFLNNLVSMVSEETSTEYIILWTSYNLKEEYLED